MVISDSIIRIHPDYREDSFAMGSILCHELAHFILDHNSIRKGTTHENEKLTDLFVFRCGQGLIYLQGILDLTTQNRQTVESKLGYLSLGEMAYSHVRCSSQHGLDASLISPSYYSGKSFEQVKKAMAYLTLKNGSANSFAEIVLCPNNHILRVSSQKSSQIIRCPRCKWEGQFWRRKREETASLLKQGIELFDTGDFGRALAIFRKIQGLEKTHSMSYCWASRCLRKISGKQDAIRELQKILAIKPEDNDAQNEMKSLIYN